MNWRAPLRNKSVLASSRRLSAKRYDAARTNTAYLEHELTRTDNKRSERAIKPFVIDHKN